jgi:hypothetical protein
VSRKIRSVAAGAALALGTVVGQTQQADAVGLDGATVTYGGYCCTAPVPADLVTNTPSATVGPGVEFPLGSIHASGSLSVIPFSLDVSSNMLDATFFSSGTLLSGGFNGGVITFSGAPPIVDVTVDPASDFIPTVLSFTSTSISNNVEGKPFVAGTHEILDVVTGTGPVLTPEPSTGALIGTGVASLIFLRRRRVSR